MGEILPYLLVVIFFAAFVPLVLMGIQVRDPDAAEEMPEERTERHLHVLERMGEIAAAGVATLLVMFMALIVLLRRKRA